MRFYDFYYREAIVKGDPCAIIMGLATLLLAQVVVVWVLSALARMVRPMPTEADVADYGETNGSVAQWWSRRF